jgi:hypothetical protein
MTQWLGDMPGHGLDMNAQTTQLVVYGFAKKSAELLKVRRRTVREMMSNWQDHHRHKQERRNGCDKEEGYV